MIEIPSFKFFAALKVEKIKYSSIQIQMNNKSPLLKLSDQKSIKVSKLDFILLTIDRFLELTRYYYKTK